MPNRSMTLTVESYAAHGQHHQCDFCELPQAVTIKREHEMFVRACASHAGQFVAEAATYELALPLPLVALGMEAARGSAAGLTISGWRSALEHEKAVRLSEQRTEATGEQL